MTSTLQESTFLLFSDTFETHTLTHTNTPTTLTDLGVAYLNIRTLNTDKHLFITAFIHKYQIDVLFLIDTRVANVEHSKYMLKACLGTGYTVLHSPSIAGSPGGQAIIISPTWAGAYQSLWCDPTGLGFLTEVTLRSGLQDVKLYGTYWPCPNSADHSFQTVLSSRIPPSPHYTDWISFFESTLLARLHHGHGIDGVWTLGGDFNIPLNKMLATADPATLGEWSFLHGLTSPSSTTPNWSSAPTFVSTQGQSRIDHVFYGGQGCECLFSTHYAGESYGDYTDH